MCKNICFVWMGSPIELTKIYCFQIQIQAKNIECMVSVKNCWTTAFKWKTY